jgi:hypothetical protein
MHMAVNYIHISHVPAKVNPPHSYSFCNSEAGPLTASVV